MTTTVTLSADRFVRVDHLVSEGTFASTDEAVDYLLAEAMGEAPRYGAAELTKLRQGYEEALRGEFVPQEEVEAFLEDWRRNG